MTKQDWYRKTTWTDDDQADYFAHFERSRNTSRAQYLKIQAYYLFETGRRKEIMTALELINLALEKYPERIFLAELLEQKAKCLDKLRKINEAVENFLLSLQAMREIPNVNPGTPYAFGLFVIDHKIDKLYDEVLSVLDEFDLFKDPLVFPIIEYYSYGIRAIIFYRKRNIDDARVFAKKAIVASEKQYSGLVRHPEFGLVSKKADVLHIELRRISKLDPSFLKFLAAVTGSKHLLASHKKEI